MATEHASLLVAYLEAGDSEAYEALRDVLTPDIVTHTAGGSTLIGVDAQTSTWRTAHQGLSQLRHHVVDVVGGSGVIAGRVVVTGLHTGTFLGIPPTGRRIESDVAMSEASGHCTGALLRQRTPNPSVCQTMRNHRQVRD